MSIPERSQELIQKYLDLVASESELAELEGLLANDAGVAQAFAEMARLNANLQGYFRKQYKMDQVAALLNAPDPVLPSPTPQTSSGTAGQPNGKPGAPTHGAINPTEQPMPLRSTFTPRYTGPFRANPRTGGGKFNAVVRNWKPIAVALLVFVMGAGIWTVSNKSAGGARLISGRVTVAGREMTHLPENASFEVVGHEAAVIELPGGARIELAAATRGAIGRDRNQFVVKLDSGGGDFLVQQDQLRPDQPSFRVETRLGDVTTSAGRFSLDLITALPKQISPTATDSIQLPRLVVAVAQGTVTVKQAGTVTTLSAGEESVFL